MQLVLKKKQLKDTVQCPVSATEFRHLKTRLKQNQSKKLLKKNPGDFSYASYLYNKKLLPYNISNRTLIKYYLTKIQKNVLFVLESRLDSVLYRIQFCRSYGEARQMINHKKILVNGQEVTKCGYQVQPGDIIKVKTNDNSKKEKLTSCYLLKKKTLVLKGKLKKRKKRPTFILKPLHLEVNYKLKTAIYLYSPQKLYFSKKLNIDLIRRNFRRTM